MGTIQIRLGEVQGVSKPLSEVGIMYGDIGKSMVSTAIWKKHARASFSKTIDNSRVYVFSNCTRNHTITDRPSACVILSHALNKFTA